MPTNVSTPIWRCDICGAHFGEDRDLAGICESAGIPEQLAEGTPVLATVDGHFVLAPLNQTRRMGTVTTTYTREPGHHWKYSRDGRSSRFTERGDQLSPGRNGYLQIEAGAHFHARRYATSPAPQSLDRRAFMDLLGITTRTAAPVQLDHHSGRGVIANPITPPVRALFDALGVTLAKSHPSHYSTSIDRVGYLQWRNGGLRAVANHLVHTHNHLELDAEIAVNRQAWFDGADVQAFAPQVSAASKLTASKLTKPILALVDSVGVDWRPHTSASEYARYVVREVLMETTPSNPLLFHGPRIIAVGGGRGGVGKSTISAALATYYAKLGKRVTLLDADVDAPTQQHLWGLDEGIPLSDDLRRIRPVETSVPGLRVFSSGLLPSSTRPAEWSTATVMAWLDFIGGALDVQNDDLLIVDLPAGFSDVVTRFTDSETSTDIKTSALLTVTTGSAEAMSAAADSLTNHMHARHANVLVENLSLMTGRTEDGATATIRVRGESGAARTLAEQKRATYGGTLPWADTHLHLADTPELAHLATLVLAATERTTS